MKKYILIHDNGKLFYAHHGWSEYKNLAVIFTEKEMKGIYLIPEFSNWLELTE